MAVAKLARDTSRLCSKQLRASTRRPCPFVNDAQVAESLALAMAVAKLAPNLQALLEAGEGFH